MWIHEENVNKNKKEKNLNQYYRKKKNIQKLKQTTTTK